MKPNQDFRDLLSELSAAGVDFLIVGAHALAAHGLPRMTKDLDVWVRPSPENAAKVFRALAAFGTPLAGVEVGDFDHPGTVLQIGVEPIRIDILTEIAGVAFDEAWPERLMSAYGDVPVGVLSRRHLVLNKRAAGRPQDLVDVQRLESGDGG